MVGTNRFHGECWAVSITSVPTTPEESHAPSQRAFQCGAVLRGSRPPFSPRAIRERIVTGLRDLARRLDQWGRSARAAAADRGSLAALSDRELTDIGMRDVGAKCLGDRPWLNTFPN